MNNNHYRKHKIQAVHCAWEWDLSWEAFSAVKYIERAGTKMGSTYNDDMLKAVWYLVAAITQSDVTAERISRDVEETLGKEKPSSFNKMKKQECQCPECAKDLNKQL